MSSLSSSSGSSSNKRKRDERRVLVDEAKTSTTTSTNNSLPPEIVEEILSLLPNKSIHRFRSVSKSWSSSLVSVDFHQFRSKSSPPAETIHRFLRLHSIYYADRTKYSPPLQSFVLSSHYPDALGRAETTRGPYPFQRFEFRRFVGSCNGLVCLEHKNPKPEIVVWNPFTGLYRKLPDHVSCFYDGIYGAYGFGYDSASNDYKVFKATCPDYGDGVRVDIFSLKAGSWKEVENPARELRHLIGAKSVGLFLNGALHWESRNKKGGSGKIIAFDLGKEKFYDVPRPQSSHLQLSRYKYKHYDLGVVGEYLCVRLFGTDHQQNIVWVMKEYCNDEASWVHFVSYRGPYRMDDVAYVSDSIPISAKDGGYLTIQYSMGDIDVLKWVNNNCEGSVEAEDKQYSKKIKFNLRYSGIVPMGVPGITKQHWVGESLLDRRLFGCEYYVDGVEWSVGNGMQIRFWTDPRVGSVGPLLAVAIGEVPTALLNGVMAEYVTSNGAWNWAVFQSWLPIGVCLQIANIVPPHPAAGPDVVSWRYTASGQFITRSAYHSIQMDEGRVRNPCWQLVWCLLLVPLAVAQ
ncbi:hypothetical protein Tsubulata_049302 [Turnera subulata]|uniref:F-box domain-containing protein n=1 Tax=Turnera subulata TaxID=218843 RepID=A0A9Q0G784_9ROSI|nr:hypothetical protein Tsubulata_049302 [Turnera subulata]